MAGGHKFVNTLCALPQRLKPKFYRSVNAGINACSTPFTDNLWSVVLNSGQRALFTVI
jgi:hypothetical protein